MILVNNQSSAEETITLHVSNANITDFRPIFGRAYQGVGMDIMMPNEKAACVRGAFDGSP